MFSKDFHEKSAQTNLSNEMWALIPKGLKHLNTVLQECRCTPLHSCVSQFFLYSCAVTFIVHSCTSDYYWGQCKTMVSPLQYVLLFCGIYKVHLGLLCPAPIPIFSLRSLTSTGLASNTNVVLHRTATAPLALFNIVILLPKTKLY